jgi:tight adherence protein C
MSSNVLMAGLWSVVVLLLVLPNARSPWLLIIGLACVSMIWLPQWPLAAVVPLILIPGIRQIQRSQDRRRQEYALQMYWPWLVDLMRIAIAGGAAHGSAFDQSLAALKESPIGRFGEAVFRRRESGQQRIAAILTVAREMHIREAHDLGLAMQESERQGSDLSPLLAEQARALRERTQRRLERAANGLSVKLLIPLVICFFPTFFLVLAFSIMHSLGRFSP